MNNKQDYIIRCDRAGVFFGKIKERTGSEVTMTEVRKIWSWDGACAVEQLAQDGTKAPGNCRFTVTAWVRGDRDTTVRLLLALEDLTGMTFRELFGECEGRR